MPVFTVENVWKYAHTMPGSASMISERLSTTYSLLLQDKTKMVMYHDHELRKRLDMTIVSEGIETEEELAFMRNMRCDVAQGFLFDKPLRHDDFEERLKAEFYPEKLSVM